MPFHVSLRAHSRLVADDWESPLQGRAEATLRLRWGLVLVTGGAVWADGRLQWSEFRLMGRRLGGDRKGDRAEPGADQPPGRRSRRRPGRKSGEPPPSKSRRRRSPPDWELLLAIAREAMRLPEKLWRSLGVRLTAEATYGFSDPSVTGFCEALRWSTGLGRGLRLTPDFRRPCLVGSGELSGRLYGFRLVAIAWQVVRNPAIWNHLVGKIPFRPLRAILLRGGA